MALRRVRMSPQEAAERAPAPSPEDAELLRALLPAVNPRRNPEQAAS